MDHFCYLINRLYNNKKNRLASLQALFLGRSWWYCKQIRRLGEVEACSTEDRAGWACRTPNSPHVKPTNSKESRRPIVIVIIFIIIIIIIIINLVGGSLPLDFFFEFELMKVTSRIEWSATSLLRRNAHSWTNTPQHIGSLKVKALTHWLGESFKHYHPKNKWEFTLKVPRNPFLFIRSWTTTCGLFKTSKKTPRRHKKIKTQHPNTPFVQKKTPLKPPRNRTSLGGAAATLEPTNPSNKPTRYLGLRSRT